MANLERMTDAAAPIGPEPRARLDLVIVACGQPRRCGRVFWKQAQKRLETIGVEAELRRKLPQNRSQLVLERQDAGRKEVRDRGVDVLQLLHMCDEAATLDRELEAARRRIAPA